MEDLGTHAHFQETVCLGSQVQYTLDVGWTVVLSQPAERKTTSTAVQEASNENTNHP